MKFVDYYSVLELNRNASQSLVDNVYKILAKQYHPDLNDGTEEHMKLINEAYGVLGNEVTRNEYNKLYDSLRVKNDSNYKKSTMKKNGKKLNWWLPIVVILLVGIFIQSIERSNIEKKQLKEQIRYQEIKQHKCSNVCPLGYCPFYEEIYK
ncbi:MAG: J domain-containing protein [Clostridium sp.]